MLKLLLDKYHAVSPILGPYKKFAAVFLFIMLFAAFFEAIGLGLIIPLIAIILGGNTGGGNSKVIVMFNEAFSRVVPNEMQIVGICAIILVVYIIKNGLLYLKLIMAQYFQNSLRKYWSVAILEKYITAEYDYIISRKRGSLINNLINEPLVSARFMFRLSEFIARIFVLMSILTMMLIINWQIVLGLCLVGGIVLGLFWLTGRKIAYSVGNERIPLIQEITAEGEQSLNAIRQVKLFSIEKEILKDFSKKFDYLKKILVKLEYYQNIPVPLGEIFIVFIIVSALIYYRYIIDIPLVNILPIMAFVVVSAQKIFQSASALVSDRMFLASYMPSVRMIGEILTDREIKKEKLNGGVKIERLQDDIVFEDITFSYGGSKTVLNNINICIPRNKITAVTGVSGSGKSTLVDLLCGLYKDYKGKIRVGNAELKELNLTSWRKMIGFVSQDVFLFNTNVRENLLVGNNKAREEELIKSCKAAGAYDFIENLPHGFDTALGDRGLKISGGQRQRLTIARAFVRSPQIIIFDEGTSALDKELEAVILQSLEAMKKDTSILIVTHRLSTLKNADNIYFINNGSVVESGAYDELIERKGSFYNMFIHSS